MFRFLAVAAVCLVAAHAHAQSSSGGMLGTCTGGNLQGSVGLAIRQSDGSYQSVAPSSIGYAFSGADCTCATTDIALQIQVTQTLPTSPAGTVQVWVGNGCDSYTVRTNPTQKQCAQVPTTLNFQNFTSFSSGGLYLYQPLPANVLFDPINNTCSLPSAGNNAYVIITLTDPNSPSVCSLNLTEYTSTPAAFTASTSAGDQAISVNWTQPDRSLGNVPSYFQVLCADENYQPIVDPAQFDQAYSACVGAGDGGVGGTMYRRKIPQAGSTTGTGTGTDDMGTGTAATAPGFVGSAAAFAQGDPNYRCTAPIAANTTSARVDGLTNGTTYFFRVVAADAYGNFTTADAGTGVPQPAEDLYRRYADQGGKASGFCFIATAAFGSYESRWVRVLRDFRDQWLLPTAEGRAFVDWYYAHSPPAADYIARHPGLRATTQALLWPVIAVAAWLVYTGPLGKLLCIALAAGLLALRERRRRRAAGVA